MPTKNTYNNPKSKKSQVNYRKIWIDAYGPIPEDYIGRSYHIHHIDGNRNNNSLENLACVSIQEHYYIHLSQDDYGACQALARLLNISKAERSKISSKCQQKLVQNGTHHLLKRSDGSSHASDRVQNGTHNWSKRPDGTSMTGDRAKDPNYINPFAMKPDGNSVGKTICKSRIENGTHNFQKRKDGGSFSKDRVNSGNHEMIKKYTCPVCGLIGNGIYMFRDHFKNCKNLIYKVTFPNNHEEMILDLKSFCDLHKLSCSAMKKVGRNQQKHHKNFKCEIMTNDL